MRFTSLLVLLCLSLVPSCASYRKLTRGISNKVGAIMTSDHRNAAAWRDVLYKNSGYTRKQVEIEAGSGVTHLTIREVKPGEDPNTLAENLRLLAARKGEVFGITTVEVKLRQ